MLRALVLTAIFSLFSGVCGVAQAQSRAPEPSAERYSFQVTDQGVLRLDSRTGEISQCAVGPAGLVCRATPDERAALEREIARLEAENAALRKALASGDGPPPIPPALVPDGKDKSAAQGSPPAQDEPQPAKGRIRTALDTAWRNLVALMSRMKNALQ